MLRHFTVIVAIAAALAPAARSSRQQMPPPMVGFIVIKEQPVPLTAELPGRTDPFAVSDVRPQVSGIIQAAPVHRRQHRQGRARRSTRSIPRPIRPPMTAPSATLASAKVKADALCGAAEAECDRAAGR